MKGGVLPELDEKSARQLLEAELLQNKKQQIASPIAREREDQKRSETEAGYNWMRANYLSEETKESITATSCDEDGRK